MAEMHHEIQITTASDKVYQALTTQAGLRSWWTADSHAEPRVGSTAEFGFNKKSVVFKMRIDELTPGQRVVWSCVGDHDEWRGTKLTWDISHKDGVTTLRFNHNNWRSATDFFASCNSTWGMLMYRLKDAVEGKSPGPYWKE
jgi:uncharacterized protein YndB with AHSA1/START domain